MSDAAWKTFFQLRALGIRLKSFDLTGRPSEQKILKSILDAVEEAYSRSLDAATAKKGVPS